MNKSNKSGIPAPDFSIEEPQDKELIAKTEVGESRGNDAKPNHKFWEVPDITEVLNKNPKLEYRWVDRKKQNMSTYKGWRVVQDSGNEKTVLGEKLGSTHVIGMGDNLLMCMPKKDYAERKEHELRDARARHKANKAAEGKPVDFGPIIHMNP